MDNGVLKSSSSSSGASSSGFSSSAGGGGVGLVSPKSPPSGSLDLYGKRRQLVKVQVLEREIALLQEELKDVEVLQPASKCCRELHDFVDGRQDPLVPLKEVPRHLQKPCLCWKQLCLPWACCISDCQCCQVKLPKCQTCCSCLGRCNCRRSQRQSDTNSSSSSCCSCWGKPSCKRSNCCSNTATGCCCLKKMNPSSWLCCNCTKVKKKVCCSSCSNNSCSSSCCSCSSSCYNPCCCFGS